jgi:hypothetical protein
MPKLGVELLNEFLWWSLFTLQIGTGFSKNRAAKLHSSGLMQIRDTRVGERFLLADEANVTFWNHPGRIRCLGQLCPLAHGVLGSFTNG